MSAEQAKELGIENLHPIKMIVPGDKGGILNGVVKVSERGVLEVHIDTDEAAAFALNNDDIIEVEL